MCCFSHPVESVTNTRIFARDSRAILQHVVYQMVFSSAEDVAMILPLPVPSRTSERSVRFIDLEKYPSFFSSMENGFTPPSSGGLGGAGGGGGFFGGTTKLKVIDVGSFEASYVPTVKDFARLDERFRLPTGTWDQLPQYASYGFAVFKLKKGHREIHPMAFEFPRADRTRLFFPTVHIHDGKVHNEADFDHVLYAQFGAYHDLATMDQWSESRQPAGMFMDARQCEGLIVKSGHVYKKVIKGKFTNEDVFA